MINISSALHKTLTQLQSTLKEKLKYHSDYCAQFISTVGKPDGIVEAVGEIENKAEIISLCGLVRQYEHSISYGGPHYLKSIEVLLAEWNKHAESELNQILSTESGSILEVVQKKIELDHQSYLYDQQIYKIIKQETTENPLSAEQKAELKRLNGLNDAVKADSEAQFSRFRDKYDHQYIADIFRFDATIAKLLKQMEDCHAVVLPKLHALLEAGEIKLPVPPKKTEYWDDMDCNLEKNIQLPRALSTKYPDELDLSADLSNFDDLSVSINRTLTPLRDTQSVLPAHAQAVSSADDVVEVKQNQLKSLKHN